MDETRIDKLQKDPRWVDWRSFPRSSLLFLVGYNYDEGFNQCWVSPAAVQLVRTMHNASSSNTDICAFYVFGIRPGQRNGEHLTQVLAHILIQLLSQKLSALQDGDKWDDLQAAFEEYATVVAASMKDPKNTFKTPKKMAIVQTAVLKVLSLLSHKRPEEQKTIWIIIDRLDRVKEPPLRLLEVLEHLVENAKVKAKILAVVNGWDWKGLRSGIASLSEKRDEGVIV